MNDTNRFLLVTQYDGGEFAGWQRQPDVRTVQGEMERVLQRLCGSAVPVTGSGRTDAGVHARGQGVGVSLPARWDARSIRRAVNALLPRDIWVESAHPMVPEFHARRSAISRRYRYLLGTDDAAHSPFRRRYEWAMHRAVNAAVLGEEAAALVGEHCFRAFAVAHTAPVDDHHRCIVSKAAWIERDGGWVFEVVANRFLHHMVRFLVGTMVDVASGKRPRGTVARLLEAGDNSDTSAPAPPHGLYLESVTYPDACFLDLP